MDHIDFEEMLESRRRELESMFEEMLESRTREVESMIAYWLPREEGFQKSVIQAMNYSVQAGGKRLRPMLMRETFRMCGGGDGLKVVGPFLAAIEMIHTYSLVHDDLPAMDNDRYRRGKETTWAVYGDALGILAGDGLLNYAYETALWAFDGCVTPEEHGRVITALRMLARYSGIYGMIGGQTADIEAEGQKEPVTEKQLIFIHEHKTAALIQAAMTVGAVLAGAGEEKIRALKQCAYNIGIAFQIQDDILDVTGDSRELGKAVGSDEQNNKQTYVTLKGLERSRADVEAMTKEAVRILDGFEGENEFLKQLVLELVHRRK